MSESAPPPAPPARIPFSPAYLAAVLLMVALNTVIFTLLGRKLLRLFEFSSTLWVIGFLFGLLFAGACSLSSLSLARWIRRQDALDRVLLFLLVELAGMTFLALALRYLLPSLAGLEDTVP